MSESSEHDRSDTDEGDLEGIPDLRETVRRVQAFANEMREVAVPGSASQIQKHYERRSRLARVVNRLNDGRADPSADSLDEIISFLEEEVEKGIDDKARSLYGDSIKRRVFLELGLHDSQLTLAQAFDRLIQRCRTLEGLRIESVSDSVEQHEEPGTVTVYVGAAPNGDMLVTAYPEQLAVWARQRECTIERYDCPWDGDGPVEGENWVAAGITENWSDD